MRTLLVVVCLALAGGTASAAEQTVSGRVVVVKNIDNEPSGRKIIYKTNEPPGTPHTVVGDPTTPGGARLKVRLGERTQCFTMPAEGWRPLPGGYKYQDLAGNFGPVTLAQIRRKGSGAFQLKTVMSGKKGLITVYPPASELDTNFSLAGGDQYCAAFGEFPGGGTVVTTGPKTFKVSDPDPPASCRITPCSPSGAFIDAVPSDAL